MSWGKLMTDWLDGQCQWGVGVRNKRSTGCMLVSAILLVLLLLVVVRQVFYFANFTRRPLRSPVCGLWGQLFQGGLDRGHLQSVIKRGANLFVAACPCFADGAHFHNPSVPNFTSLQYVWIIFEQILPDWMRGGPTGCTGWGCRASFQLTTFARLLPAFQSQGNRVDFSESQGAFSLSLALLWLYAYYAFLNLHAS